MDSFIDKLVAIQKFLKILTWRKIAQVFISFLIVGIAWFSFMARESLYNFISQSKLAIRSSSNVTLSKRTKGDIIASVDKSDLIIGIQITIVDFQKNTKLVIFTYTDDNNVKKIWTDFESVRLVELPLFNADIQNNKRMVDLINGEFICNNFTDTIGYKLSPEAAKYISTVCANGIPPFYGKFTGIVSVYTKRVPAPEEVDQIRTLTKGLSSDIYERDLNK